MNEEEKAENIKQTAQVVAVEVLDRAKDKAEGLIQRAEILSQKNDQSYNSLHDKLDMLNISSAVIQEKIAGTNRRLDVLNGKVAEHEKEIETYEKKIQLLPLIQKIVFGAATLILIGFMSALIALIITKR